MIFSRRKKSNIKTTLIVKGEDNIYTAMAKTVGLPLGIAAKLILEEKIKEKGKKAETVESIIPIDQITETKVLISFK